MNLAQRSSQRLACTVLTYAHARRPLAVGELHAHRPCWNRIIPRDLLTFCPSYIHLRTRRVLRLGYVFGWQLWDSHAPLHCSTLCGALEPGLARDGRSAIENYQSDEVTSTHLHMRPLIHLNTDEPVSVHPATSGASVSTCTAYTHREDGMALRGTHQGNAFMSAMLYEPHPRPASQSRSLRRMSSTPYSRFVSSR